MGEEQLRIDLATARQTNARLNARCQEAEAAAHDADRCVQRMATTGTPWVNGSFGRALLAWKVSDLEKRIAEQDALIASLSTRLADASEALGRAAERKNLN